MGDIGDYWRDARDYQRNLRLRLGVSCPKGNEKEPFRTPTILLPGQTCRVDGYRDPRTRKRKKNNHATASAGSKQGDA
jgi:hypothetical protein